MHYRKYDLLLIAEDTPWPLMQRILDQHETDAVLLRRWERVDNLRTALRRAPEWLPALLGADSDLFLRRGSRGLAQLGQRLRRGEEWRPDTTPALAAQGFIWQALSPPDLERALACWTAALRRNMRSGTVCFRPVTATLLELGRRQEARRFIATYQRRLTQPFTRLPDTLRQELLEILAECRRDVEAPAATPRKGE